MAENIRGIQLKEQMDKAELQWSVTRNKWTKDRLHRGGFAQPAPLCSLPNSQTLDRSPEVSDLSE